MVKFPIIHEVVTIAGTVGALATWDKDGADKIIDEYYDESVIGSTVAAAINAISGRPEDALRSIKGAGRATGHALVGGGILPEEIPVLKEINKVGKAVGDLITGDPDKAGKRFTEEWVEEYTDPKFFQNASLAAVNATVGAVVVFATAGMGASAFIACSTAASAGTTAALNAADQGIDIARGTKEDFDGKELLQATVTGAIVGAAASSVSPISADAATKNLNVKGVSGFAKEAGRQFTGIGKPKDYKKACGFYTCATSVEGIGVPNGKITSTKTHFQLKQMTKDQLDRHTKVVKKNSTTIALKKVSAKLFLHGRYVNFPSNTTKDGCWLFKPSSTNKKWELWYADAFGDHRCYDSGSRFQSNAKIVRDGIGGVWVLSPTDAGCDLDWRLCHIDGNGEKRLFQYPCTSKLIGGGNQDCVWISFCNKKSANKSQWKLWLVTMNGRGREEKKYTYPKNSKFASDGEGGVWVLAPRKSGKWCLWHVSKSKEGQYYEYPKDSQMIGDGCGGVWVLCNKGKGDGTMCCLWHATKDGETNICKYAANTKMVSDGKGGVYALTNRRLWHVSKNDKQKSGEKTNLDSSYPNESKMAPDGIGGVWMLAGDRTNDAEGNWVLWHHVSNKKDKGKKIVDCKFPPDTKLVGDVWDDHNDI